MVRTIINKKSPYIKARHGQVCSLQIGPAQVTVAQIGSSQVGHLKVYVTQIQARQICTVKVKTLTEEKYCICLSVFVQNT